MGSSNSNEAEVSAAARRKKLNDDLDRIEAQVTRAALTLLMERLSWMLGKNRKPRGSVPRKPRGSAPKTLKPSRLT